MTREEHFKLNREYREKSIAALRRYRESLNKADFDEYDMYYRLANKEFGIAMMMHTKALKKIMKGDIQ